MSASGIPDSILAPLAAVQRLLTRFSNRGIIIGGVAVSLLGTPRFTADVDAVVLLTVEDLPELLEAARQEGLYCYSIRKPVYRLIYLSVCCLLKSKP